MCAALGGSNFYFIFCLSVKLGSWFNPDNSNCNFRTALLKLEPKSEAIVFGLPLLLMNLCRAFMNESEPSDSTNSKCIALVAIHANKQPHLFSECRCLMSIGPNK